MTNPLLDRVLPAEMADRSQVIEYKGKVGDFERLVAIVEEDLEASSEDRRRREWQAAPVDVRLEFDWVDARREIPLAKGLVSARLTVVCQRCLEAFEMPLEATIRMMLVDTEAGDGNFAKLAACADLEIWELEEETLRPLDMIEESLIMAMPLAPMHESQDFCGPLARNIVEETSGTIRPFADLGSLLKRQTD